MQNWLSSLLTVVRNGTLSLLILSLTAQPILLHRHALADDTVTTEKNSSPQFKDRYKEFSESLQSAFDGSESAHPLDTWRLLDQETVPYQRVTKTLILRTLVEKDRAFEISRNQVSIRVVDEKNQTIRQISARDFKRSTRKSFSAFFEENTSNTGFEIVFQGETIARYDIPVDSIGFYDGKVVFIEKNSYLESTKTQNIQFLDLVAYGPALGRTKIPVFRAPLKADAPVKNFAISEGKLFVDGVHVDADTLESYSEMQEMSFNVMANLADPSRYPETIEIAGELQDVFKRLKELTLAGISEQQGNAERIQQSYGATADRLQKIINSRAQLGTPEEIKKINEQTSEEDWGKSFAQQAGLEKIIEGIGKNRVEQAKFINRFRLLWARLSAPRPLGAPSIEIGLKVILAGMKARNIKDFREGVLRVLQSGPIKKGGTLTSAAAMAFFYPEQSAELMMNGFDIVYQVVYGFLGGIRDTGLWAGEAFKDVFGGVSWEGIRNQYVANGRLPKLGVGLSALVSVLYIVLGTPHMIVNSLKLVGDMYRLNKSGEFAETEGLLRRQAKIFVHRQNVEKTTYEAKLKEAEADAHKENATTVFTEEEDLKVQEIVTKLKEEHQGLFGRLLNKIQETKIYSWFQNRSSDEISGVTGALTHFLFSFASLTHTARAYTVMWNWWFKFRSFFPVYHPMVTATFITHPQYYATVINAPQGKLSFPTQVNGAQDGFFKRWGLRAGAKTDIAEWEWVKKKVLGDRIYELMPSLKDLKAWEAKILGVEKVIHDQALQASFRAMTQYVQDHESIRKIISGRVPQSTVQKSIMELPKQQRTFFWTYFNQTFETALGRYLQDFARKEQGELVSPDLISIKKATIHLGDQLELSKEQARTYVNEVIADPKTFEQAKEYADIAPSLLRRVHDFVRKKSKVNFLRSASNTAIDAFEAATSKERRRVLKTERKFKTLAVLSPDQNRQIERIQVVQSGLNDVKSMIRATRSLVSSMVVDKPMELAMLLLLYSGINKGIMVPMYDEAFSSNSWNFMSRYVFLTGFTTGIIYGTLSHPWGKIQSDAQHGSDKLNVVPEGEDAKLSYFRYWLKRTFQTSGNSFWESHKYVVSKVIIPNIPAAFITFSAIYLSSLNRFDLDLFLIGYMSSIFLPVSGIAQKLEQGFELSVGYVAKDIPERLRAHPVAQGYINRAAMKKRYWFNVFYKVYENTLGAYMDVFLHGESAEFGKRAITRILTPQDMLVTEWIANPIRQVINSPRTPNFVAKALNVCDELLTNKMEDATKLIPKTRP